MSDPERPARVSTGMQRLVWSVALITLAACGAREPSGPLAQLQPKLNEPFTLRAGQAATFFEPALSITFAGVPNDSRCPTDAMCIWAGDGEVQLTLHVGPLDGDGADLDAHLHTNLEPHSAPWGVYYEIRLLALNPQPSINHPMGEYRATLVVESH